VLSRRLFVVGTAAFPIGVAAIPIVANLSALADPVSDALAIPFDELAYPPLEALTAPQPFGILEPDANAKAKAGEIIKATPKGPTPIDIAQSFVDRFFSTDPEAISQMARARRLEPIGGRVFHGYRHAGQQRSGAVVRCLR
jgi:hypothetical protein